MFVAEYRGSCQTTIDDTVVTIESQCLDKNAESILEALVRLMKRDVAGVENDDT